MSNLPPEEMKVVTLSDVLAYESGLAAGRRESAERLEVAERLTEMLAAGLHHFWGYATCPCGARIESPHTHPHVGGCPVGVALARWREVTP